MRLPNCAQSVWSVPRPHAQVMPLYPNSVSVRSIEPAAPSSHMPFLALVQLSLPTTSMGALSRGPQFAQLVPYAQIAGSRLPTPPSRHLVSPGASAPQVSEHCGALQLAL